MDTTGRGLVYASLAGVYCYSMALVVLVVSTFLYIAAISSGDVDPTPRAGPLVFYELDSPIGSLRLTKSGTSYVSCIEAWSAGYSGNCRVIDR